MEGNDQATVEGLTDAGSRKRPRKKFLYSQILHQMEFYFSDANLLRDRFLGQLLQKNKNVPLDVFLKFNKIRALTSSAEEIAKALGTSELLKVTEDGKHVYRTRPVQEKENLDDCMIYVEQLPPDANHEWVEGIFSSYGKVVYVSIPKFKTRPAIKGFAFVEFDSPEAAKRALEAFGTAGCCIPQQIPPEELCSVATFESEDQDDVNTKGEHEPAEKQSENNKKIKGEGLEEAGSELMEEENFGGEEEVIDYPKSKKLKTEIDESQVGEKQKKKKKIGKEDDSEYTVTGNESAETVKTKKSMKRKLENENIECVNDLKSGYLEESNESCSVAKKKKKTNVQEVVDDETELTEEADKNETLPAVKNKKKKKQKFVDNASDEVETNPEEIEEETGVNQEENDNDSVARKKKKKKVQEDEVDDVSELPGETAESETLTAVKSKKKKKQKLVEGASGEVETDPEQIEEETGVNQDVQPRKKKSKKREHRNDEDEDDGDRIVEDAEDEGTSEKAKKQTDEDGDEDEVAGADSGKPKKKIRAKKKSGSKKKNVEKKEIDPISLGLRILSKKEWTRLRNKYLNLQREKMRELKKHLARSKFGSNYQSPYPAKDNGNPELKKESKPESKKTQFIPGVIVHVDLGEPLEEVKSFKNSAKTEPGVAYVDANEGSSEVYIRCFSSEAAQNLLDKNQWDNMEILQGEAEKEYWKKIFADRESKIKGKGDVPKAKGRNKLLKRAERELGKHIKFDD